MMTTGGVAASLASHAAAAPSWSKMMFCQKLKRGVVLVRSTEGGRQRRRRRRRLLATPADRAGVAATARKSCRPADGDEDASSHHGLEVRDASRVLLFCRPPPKCYFFIFSSPNNKPKHPNTSSSTTHDALSRQQSNTDDAEMTTTYGGDDGDEPTSVHKGSSGGGGAAAAAGVKLAAMAMAATCVILHASPATALDAMATATLPSSFNKRVVIDPRELKSPSSSSSSSPVSSSPSGFYAAAADDGIAAADEGGGGNNNNIFTLDNTFKFYTVETNDDDDGGGDVGGGGGGSDAAGAAGAEPSAGEQIGQAIQAFVKPLLSEFGAAVLGFGAGSVFIGFFMGWQQSNRGKKSKRASNRQALADLSMLDEAEIQELIGELPAWLAFRDVERAGWLNKARSIRSV